MELRESIEPGMKREESFQIEDEYSAIHVGSGASRVLATPWMIAFMERVSHRLLAEHLAPGSSSVGILVNIRHLAPTPVGSRVRVLSEVQEVDGPKVTFLVEAWDEHEKIGEGQHQRMVIDEERFLRRVNAKIQGT
jgi:fluoroacetyl-CoA thioesterase